MTVELSQSQLLSLCARSAVNEIGRSVHQQRVTDKPNCKVPKNSHIWVLGKR